MPNVLIRRTGQQEFPCLLPTGSTLSHPSHLNGRHQPSVPLETRLVQKPVHHRRPTEDGPQPASGQLSSPCQVTTVSGVSSHTVQATTRQHKTQDSIFFVAVRPSCAHTPLPTTSTQLTLDACGPSWSRSGPWHTFPPHTGNKRDQPTNISQRHNEGD